MKKYFLLLIIFIVLSTIFLVHYFIVGNAVYGDGKYYWSYSRSIIKDKNLDLRNENNHDFSRKQNNVLEKDNFSGKPVESWFPIGTSLFWLPTFALADIVGNTVYIFNNQFPNNGYSHIYQISIGLTNIFFVVLGIACLWKFLTNFFPEHISWLAVLTWLFASNLLYYSSVDVINSHPLSFFLSSFFIYFWYKSLKNRTLKQWLIIGLALGFMSIVRTQDLLFILFPLMEFLILKTKWKEKIMPFLYFLITAGTIYLSQIIIWNNMYHGLTISPYMRSGFSLGLPNLYQVFLGSYNGLLRWTPIFLFGFIGLFLFKKKYIWYGSLVFVIMQLILIINWSGFVIGGSYGMRLLLSSSFGYCLGLASFYERAEKMLTNRWILIFSILLCFLNMTNIIYFLLFVQ